MVERGGRAKDEGKQESDDQEYDPVRCSASMQLKPSKGVLDYTLAINGPPDSSLRPWQMPLILSRAPLVVASGGTSMKVRGQRRQQVRTCHHLKFAKVQECQVGLIIVANVGANSTTEQYKRGRDVGA